MQSCNLFWLVKKTVHVQYALNLSKLYLLTETRHRHCLPTLCLRLGKFSRQSLAWLKYQACSCNCTGCQQSDPKLTQLPRSPGHSTQLTWYAITFTIRAGASVCTLTGACAAASAMVSISNQWSTVLLAYSTSGCTLMVSRATMSPLAEAWMTTSKSCLPSLSFIADTSLRPMCCALLLPKKKQKETQKKTSCWKPRDSPKPLLLCPTHTP